MTGEPVDILKGCQYSDEFQCFDHSMVKVGVYNGMSLVCDGWKTSIRDQSPLLKLRAHLLPSSCPCGNA